MKSFFAMVVVLVVTCSAANASAQVLVGPPVAPLAVAPAVVMPPAPIVAYYAAPAVAYTPGYVFSAGPMLPAPLYYSVRQRTYFRGPFYRSTVRYRGW